MAANSLLGHQFFWHGAVLQQCSTLNLMQHFRSHIVGGPPQVSSALHHAMYGGRTQHPAGVMISVAATIIVTAATATHASVAVGPPCAPFSANLSGWQMVGGDFQAATHSSVEACEALCCQNASCTTWNIQVR
jgi:hypothetical protein